MDKPLRDWTEADIAFLVQSGRTEGPTLEYKAALYDTNERGNREFLLDICSLANSSGGILLIGIAEERDQNGPTGAPDQAATLGVECDNPEQVLTSSETRILDTIDQRLLIESHAIVLSNGRKILVFRVRNSVDKPHRVYLQGRTSFPARRERQRYELNATEIKDMVMKTATRIDAAEQEIDRALSAPVEPYEYPTLRVALLPVFTRNFAVDFRRQVIIDGFARMSLTAQESGAYVQPAFSMDGLVRHGPARGLTISLGHNGLILLKMRIPGWRAEGILSFNPLSADIYIRGIAQACGTVYSAANLTPPIVLRAALNIPQECLMQYEGTFEDGNRVQALTKIYPSLVLGSLDTDLDPQIRPLCDLIHQSLGEPRSRAFGENGNWVYTRGANRN